MFLQHRPCRRHLEKSKRNTRTLATPTRRPRALSDPAPLRPLPTQPDLCYRPVGTPIRTRETLERGPRR